jgi:hypothetical protein
MGVRFLIDSLVFGFGLLLVSTISLRAFFKFYSRLRLYHKVPSQYDPKVLLPEEMPDDIKERISETQLKSYLTNEPNGELYIDKKKMGKTAYNPEIVLEKIDEETVLMKRYGEKLKDKVVSLWVWTSVTVFLASALIITTFGSGTFSSIAALIRESSKQGIYEIDMLTAVAMVAILCILHLATRYASFFEFPEVSRRGRRVCKDGENDSYLIKRVNEIHESVSSVFTSIIFIWAIVIYVDFVSFGGSLPNLTIPSNDIMYVLAAIVLIPVVVNVFGELILLYTEVPEEITEDKIRNELEIDIG